MYSLYSQTLAVLETKKMEPSQEASITLSEIEDLAEFQNSIADSKDIESIVDKLFDKVIKKINPQVISIFLFSKDGYIERYRINGKDQFGENIDNQWIRNEKYLPGYGFSGQSIKNSNSENYLRGESYKKNQLNRNDKLKYSQDYIDKLGFLQCGISVPLNGTNKIFGTIEIINKINLETGNPDRNLIFSNRELCWLTVLATNVATIIYKLKNAKKFGIYANIAQILTNPSNDTQWFNEQCQSIADTLTDPLMPYKVCILRIKRNYNSLFVVKESHSNDINMESKKNSIRYLDRESMVTNTYKTLQPKIVTDIEQNIDSFISKKWIQENKLKSFICFPLKYKNEAIGTLSLFTGYKYFFNESDIKFLESVSSLLTVHQLSIEKSLSTRTKDKELFKSQYSESEITKKIEDIFKRSRWDFRTIHGLAKDLNTPYSSVQEAIKNNLGIKFRKSQISIKNGIDLYCLATKPISWRERLATIKVLITRPIDKDLT